MALADDAIRMVRTKWGDRTDYLAQELYAIFSQYSDPKTGAVTIDLGNGLPPIVIQPDNFKDPFGGFSLPDFHSPDLNRASGWTPERDAPGLQLNVTNLNFTETLLPDPSGPPNRFLRRRTERKNDRAVFPGKVVSKQSDGTYTITCYPLGTDQTSERDTFTQSGVVIPGAHPKATFPAGSYGPVWRFLQLDVVTDTMIEAVPGTGGEREISRTLYLYYRRNRFEMFLDLWL